jgi:hypothetical protein
MLEMSETLRYRYTYPLEDLASVLGVEPTREAVFTALDQGNANYGTAENTGALLGHLTVAGLSDVDDREWGFRCSWTDAIPAGEPQ